MPAQQKRPARKAHKISRKSKGYLYFFAIFAVLILILNIPLTSVPENSFVQSVRTGQNNEDSGDIKAKPEIDDDFEDENEKELEIEDELEDDDIREFSVGSKKGRLEIKTTDKSGVVSSLGENGVNQLKLTLNDPKSEVQLQADGNQVQLQVQGVTVNSDFPFIMNKATGKLQVKIDDTAKNLDLLPDRAKKISDDTGMINATEKIVLALNPQKGSGDDLVYKVQGKRKGMLLGIIPVSASVENDIGAATGKLLITKQPLWLTLFSFLIE